MVSPWGLGMVIHPLSPQMSFCACCASKEKEIFGGIFKGQNLGLLMECEFVILTVSFVSKSIYLPDIHDMQWHMLKRGWALLNTEHEYFSSEMFRYMGELSLLWRAVCILKQDLESSVWLWEKWWTMLFETAGIMYVHLGNSLRDIAKC